MKEPKDIKKRFMDKMVIVTVGDPNAVKPVQYVGKCEFVGFNKDIGWHQITVDRFPIKLDSYDQIGLYTGERNTIMYKDGILDTDQRRR